MKTMASKNVPRKQFCNNNLPKCSPISIGTPLSIPKMYSNIALGFWSDVGLDFDHKNRPAT